MFVALVNQGLTNDDNEMKRRKQLMSKEAYKKYQKFKQFQTCLFVVYMTFNLVISLRLKTTVKRNDSFPEPLQNKKKSKTAQ